MVTARDTSAVRDIAQRYGDRAIAVDLEVTKPAQISAALKEATDKFGQIDVLVNNAGYGYIGAIEFQGRSMRQSSIRLPELAETLGKQRDALLESHGKQSNDPDKGAAAIIKAIKAEHPPLHLLLGADALDLTRKQLARMAAEFDAWKTLTRSTAFDETA